jgi:acetolactate synthase I/II/III large subunit
MPEFWDACGRALRSAGIEFLIGCPTDEPSLIDSWAKAGMRTLLPRDARAVGCAAAGYSHRTGLPAAIELPTGPALLSSLAGISELASLRQPAVVITTSVPAGRRLRGDFQDVPQRDLLGSFAKWYHQLDDPTDLEWAVGAARWTAAEGAPGIAVIDIPATVPGRPADTSGPRNPFSANGIAVPSAATLADAADLLASAERPLILVGGGAMRSGAGPAATALAHRLDAPILTTASGRGAVTETAESFLGLAGLYFAAPAAAVARRADLLVAVGTRIEETVRLGWPELASLPQVRIDTDHEAAYSGFAAGRFLLGDAAATLPLLTEKVPDRSLPQWKRDWRQARRDLLQEPGTGPVARTLQAVSAVFDEAPWHVVQENGLHDLWGYHFPTLSLGRNGTALTPGEQTMMGFAAAAALGTGTADPAADLLVTCGDGALEASIGAIATAGASGIGLTVVAWDNGGWGWPRLSRDDTASLMDFGPGALRAAATLFDEVHWIGDADSEAAPALRAARETARRGGLALLVVPADDKDAPPAVAVAAEESH